MRIETEAQNKFVGIFMGILFLGGGIAFLIAVLLSQLKDKEFNEANGQTMAYVEKIERDEEFNDVIYVTYTVDGKEYSNVELGYESSAAEGYKISIYYDKSNPAIIVEKDFVVQNEIVGYCISGVLIIAGIVALIIGLKKKTEKTAKPEAELSYNKQKMQIKIAVFSVAIVCIGIGIAMVISSSKQSPEAKDFQKNAVAVTAYVDDVIEDRRVTDNASHTTYYYTVSYEYEGAKFSNITFITQREYFKEGKYVTIYCHKEKPHIVEPRLSTETDNILLRNVGWGFTGFGAFMVFIGIVAKPVGSNKE